MGSYIVREKTLHADENKGEGGSGMKTKGEWKGVLRFEDGEPKKIIIGSFQLNSFFYFLSGKRIIMDIQMIIDGEIEDSGSLSTTGKLEYDEKKKQFTLEKYPLTDMLESFHQKKIKLNIELDQSVLSSRM
jgi:hypothetical protein